MSAGHQGPTEQGPATPDTRARVHGSACSARNASRELSRPKQRPPGRAPERVRQHLAARGAARSRDLAERGRHVPHLHPALGPPAHELDLLGLQVRAAHDRRRAVVLVDAVVDDRGRARGSPASSACPGYGVGCWMYGQSTYFRANVRLASIDSRVSSGLPTMSPPTTNMPCRCRMSIARHRRVADRAGRLAASAVLGARLQERQVVLEDVLDAEEHVAEPGPPHQRRQRRRRGWRSARSSPARCSRCRSARRR